VVLEGWQVNDLKRVLCAPGPSRSEKLNWGNVHALGFRFDWKAMCIDPLEGAEA
jgi:hypothetical protein